MKLSIQILIGLFVLVVSGLFLSKYKLKQQYDAIDKSDIYYTFNTINNLDFSHVKINGGNKSHLTIEPGESNQLLINKELHDRVVYEINYDTLFVHFNEDQTNDQTNFNNQWASREYSSVFIQSNTIKSVSGNNASITVDLGNTAVFETELIGNTNLEIIRGDQRLNSLRVKSSGVSKFRFNREGETSKIAFLGLTLNGESLAELYNIESDSSFLEMEPHSRISADAIFFNNN